MQLPDNRTPEEHLQLVNKAYWRGIITVGELVREFGNAIVAMEHSLPSDTRPADDEACRKFAGHALGFCSI